MNILGIETSCDETAAAVVTDGRRIRSNVIASQIALHQPHGGVVPELAARQHVTAIMPVVEAALAEAGVAADEIDVVAPTQGPGLAAALLVGMNVAKALAYSLDRPLVPVNHLEGHIYAAWLGAAGEEPVPAPRFPLLCLLVSGGHTELILMPGHGRYIRLGRTLDDAAGEAFDKGARLLGLGYPGGPAIQKAAAQGVAGRVKLPRAWLGDSYDFSFSGLKTALLHMVSPYRLPDEPVASAPTTPFPAHRPPRYAAELPLADIAAEFQEAIVEVLAVKAARAAKATGAKTVVLAGGVAANAALRQRLLEEVAHECGENTVEVRYPPFALCTDNAAMIAGAAFYALQRGEQAGWDVDVHPRLPLAVSESGQLSLPAVGHGPQ